MGNEEVFFNRKEAAQFMRRAVPTLDKERVLGGGPAFSKIGRRVVYARSDLLAFMQNHRRKSTSDPGSSNSAVA